MSDAFQERTFSEGRTVEEITTAVNTPGGCFELYRVKHRASLLATDGKHMICWFAAPDAESLRSALRRMEADSSGVWAGASYEAAGLTRNELTAANVVVELNFAEPTRFDTIQAQESAAASSLAMHQAKFVLALLARDGKRVLLLYKAPDPDSVGLSLRQAEFPVNHIWTIHTICSTPKLADCLA